MSQFEFAAALVALDAPFHICWAESRERAWDLVNALSAYHDALVKAIGKLDDFPDELKEFAVEERIHLEAAIKQIEDRLNEAASADRT